MMELEKLIEVERERCATLVEGYRPRCHGLEESIIVRILNQIRNGLEPERFEDQIVSTETTAYASPTTVEEERARCMTCVAMHSNDGTTRLQAMLHEMVRAIGKVTGPS